MAGGRNEYSDGYKKRYLTPLFLFDPLISLISNQKVINKAIKEMIKETIEIISDKLPLFFNSLKSCV